MTREAETVGHVEVQRRMLGWMWQHILTLLFNKPTLCICMSLGT
jgi:hypothetical protein